MTDSWINHGENLLDFLEEKSEEVNSSGDEDNNGVEDLLHDAFLIEDDVVSNNADEGGDHSARLNTDDMEQLFVNKDS